jgi:hypothetical protein
VYGRTKLAGEQAIQAAGIAAPHPAHQLGLRHARQELPADHAAPGRRTRRTAHRRRPDRRADLVAHHRRHHRAMSTERLRALVDLPDWRTALALCMR